MKLKGSVTYPGDRATIWQSQDTCPISLTPKSTLIQAYLTTSIKLSFKLFIKMCIAMLCVHHHITSCVQ